MKREEVILNILDLMKEYDYYNYRDAYQDDEEGYRDIDRTLSTDGSGIYEFLISDFNDTMRFEDIRDRYVMEHLDKTIKVLKDVNKYVNELKEKNNDIEM